MMAASMQLRTAVAGDVGALCDLEQLSFQTDRLSRRSFERLLASQTALVLVAARPGRIASALVMLFRQGARRCRLYSFAVEPALWGQGLAAEMLRSAERRASQKGVSVVRLELRRDNHRAAAFYRKLGYRPIGIRPGYYEDGEDAIRFEKNIGGVAA